MARSAPARIGTIPAPVGGWNARDPLSSMKPTDAVILENWIPTTGGIALRNGYSSHATGMGDPVESLMEYSSPTQNKLFAAADDSIYEVTSSGAVGAAAVGSLTSAKWQHTMMATSGGNFLVIANGADSVRHYNGTAWATPTINNVTSSTLISVITHQSRLWFVQKNTLKVWYLDPNGVAGDAYELDLGPFCKLGGSLQAIGSWTRDGGSGPDDVFVAITSKGEVLVYSGTDPSDANLWGLVGAFRIPEPVGRRCLRKVGSDLAVITSQGLIPLSEVLSTPEGKQKQGAITNKISGAFQSAYLAASTQPHWQIMEYPKGALLIVNVPLDSDESDQYVMNMLTGAWCKFTGLDALCWGLMGDALYFGTSAGTVFKYDTNTYDDNDSPIVARVLPAFNDFKLPGLKKHYKMARPMFIAPENTIPPVGLHTDYDTTIGSLAFSAIPVAGTAWDEGDWDTSSWGPGLVSDSTWQSLVGHNVGQTCSILVAVSAEESFTLFQTDILYELGGVL